jgi:hypothetical protein
VIVNEMEIVGRLGEVDPLPTEALDRAELVLRAAMAAAEVHESSRLERDGFPGLARQNVHLVDLAVGASYDQASPEQAEAPQIWHDRHPRGLQRRGLLAGIAAAVVVVIGIGGVLLATVTSSSRPGQGPRQASPATRPVVALTGGTIRLAAATMHLPAGFKAVPGACAPAPNGLGAPISFLNSSFAAAASANGGCIEAWLADATTTVVPPEAVPVTITGYQGELYSNQSTGFSTLYVTIPADLYVNVVTADGQPDPTATIDLVLTTNGLSANELESIAATGIPAQPAPFAPLGTSCPGGCG